MHLNDIIASPAAAVLMLDRGERVELGFRRKMDLVLFTNLRAILIDRDSQWALFGSFGRKVAGAKWEYRSVPWRNVSGFGYCSAGKWFDADQEIFLFGEDAPRVATHARVEVDVKKGCADLGAVSGFLNGKLLTRSDPIADAAQQQQQLQQQLQHAIPVLTINAGSGRPVSIPLWSPSTPVPTNTNTIQLEAPAPTPSTTGSISPDVTHNHNDNQIHDEQQRRSLNQQAFLYPSI